MFEHDTGLHVDTDTDPESGLLRVRVLQLHRGIPDKTPLLSLTPANEDVMTVELELARMVLAPICAFLNAGGSLKDLQRLLDTLAGACPMGVEGYPIDNLLAVLDLAHHVFYAETEDGIVRIVDGRRSDAIEYEEMCHEVAAGICELPSELFTDDLHDEHA